MAPRRYVGEKEKSQVTDTTRVKRPYRKSSTAERDPWTKSPKFAGQATFNLNKGLEQVRVARSPTSQTLSPSSVPESVSPSIQSIRSVSESAREFVAQSPNAASGSNDPSLEFPSVPGLIRDSMLRYLLQIQKNSLLSLKSRSPRNITTKQLLTTAYKALLQFQDSPDWRSPSRSTATDQQQPVFARRKYFESSGESENWKLHAWKQLNLLDEGLSMELDTMEQPWEKMSELLNKCRNLVKEAKSSRNNLNQILLIKFSDWMDSIHEFMETLLKAPRGSGSLDEVKSYLLEAKTLLTQLETIAPEQTQYWQEYAFGIEHYLNCLDSKWCRRGPDEPVKPPDDSNDHGQTHSDKEFILNQMFAEVANLDPITATLGGIEEVCRTRLELFNTIAATLKGWTLFGQVMPNDVWLRPEYFRQVYHILAWIALPQAAEKIIAWIQNMASAL